MNQKELQALRLMEELDGLRDDFIEAAMLPDSQVSDKSRSSRKVIRRIMKSGLTAALLAGVLYVGLLAVIVRLGQPSTNENVPGENAPIQGTQEDTTPPETQESPTVPEEGECE